ncbi:MAG: CHASE2 domain-containing protein [Acidobacteriota bacterium]|nr:CHASE2 domain-containing protein [Acidobacteriota bacterium]
MSTGEQQTRPSHRRLRHWLIHALEVVIFVAIGLYIEHHLNEKDYWIGERYSLYQILQGFTPRKPRPQRTALVLIGDDEYWKDLPAGRAPIKRDYLAELVKHIAAAGPAVIALDFDLRSPSPDGNPVEAPDFKDETEKLLNAVNAASPHQIVILPKAIGTNERGEYVSASDIYRDFKFDPKRVKTGYIALADDTRIVPLYSIDLSGDSVDSFSQAIARTYDPEAVEGQTDAESLPYGSFVETKKFKEISARRVLADDPAAKEMLAHKIVIVGGKWHAQAYETGPTIDSYDSPLGVIPGVFIHANYVEAILDSRLYRAVTGWHLAFVEVFFSAIVAVIFLLGISPFYKLLSIPVIALALVLFTYLCLMLLGVFFDFFIPVLLVIVDGSIREAIFAYRKIIGWRSDALKWRAQNAG